MKTARPKEFASRIQQYNFTARMLKRQSPRTVAKLTGLSMETIVSVLFWVIDGRPDFRDFNYSGRMGSWRDRKENVARVNDLYKQFLLAF